MGFRSEAALEEWLTATGNTRGFVTSNQAMYDFSREWYAGRMDIDWQPPTPAEAEALAARHGFTGDFWRFSS